MSKYGYAMDVLTWERNRLNRQLQNFDTLSERSQLKERIAELESAIEVLRKEGAKNRKKKRGGCNNPH